MSDEWAVRMPVTKARSAARLRLHAGILVAELPENFWLRGKLLAEDLELELRKLPGAERFDVDETGTLTPAGSRLPAGKIPELTWTPVASWFTPVSQPAALSGQIHRRVALRLIRSAGESPATVLLTTHAQWHAYAITAPQVRLKPLQVAVEQSGRTVLRGHPLPPIPGQQFVEQDGIAIPSGHAISPAMDGATMRALLGIGPQELAFFHEDGSVELIAGHEFLPASRATARATAERLTSLK